MPGRQVAQAMTRIFAPPEDCDLYLIYGHAFDSGSELQGRLR